MPQINIGLIGLGVHGARYARHLLDGDIPQARLVAVSRRNEAEGMAFASQHNLKYYADFSQLITNTQVEAVIAATTPNLNLTICKLAAQVGKPLLIEKPLACNLNEAKQIVELAQRADLFLMVAQTLRYNEVVRTIRAERPRLGRLHLISLNQYAEPFALPWQDDYAIAGGGAVLHIGVHAFDMIRYLTGEEVSHAYCLADRFYNQNLEDSFTAILTLQNGVKATVGVGRCTQGRSGRIEMVGEQGQLVGDHVLHSLYWIKGREQQPLTLLPQANTIKGIVSDLADCRLRKRCPPISGLDGLRGMQIVEACYRSIAAGKPIDVSY